MTQNGNKTMRRLISLTIIISAAFIFGLDCKRTSGTDAQILQVSEVSQETKDNELFAAIEAEDKAKVKELLKRGANPNATRKKDETYIETPLYKSLIGKYPEQVEIVELLLRSGADVNVGEWWCAESKKNCRNFPPLGTAIFSSNIPLAEVLLKYGAKTEDDFIHHAQDEKTVAFLVEHGVNINNQSGGAGDTPLMRSAFFCEDGLMDALLKYGADVFIKNKDGDTALFFAENSRCGNKEIVKTIKEAMKKQKKSKSK